jgi:hypothetical protein
VSGRSHGLKMRSLRTGSLSLPSAAGADKRLRAKPASSTFAGRTRFADSTRGRGD